MEESRRARAVSQQLSASITIKGMIYQRPTILSKLKLLGHAIPGHGISTTYVSLGSCDHLSAQRCNVRVVLTAFYLTYREN